MTDSSLKLIIFPSTFKNFGGPPLANKTFPYFEKGFSFMNFFNFHLGFRVLTSTILTSETSKYVQVSDLVAQLAIYRPRFTRKMSEIDW